VDAALLGEKEPEARAGIGRALGRLNLDTRPGVSLRADGVPDIDWVEIPGGKFIYQDGERRKIEAFSIARYPVTNIQFEAFVNAADGYSEDRWWKGMDDPDRDRRDPAWSESNHPRETVNWYEAVAFCAWLSSQTRIRRSGCLRNGNGSERRGERMGECIRGGRIPARVREHRETDDEHALAQDECSRNLSPRSVAGRPTGPERECVGVVPE
jgi:hypothetical protein